MQKKKLADTKRQILRTAYLEPLVDTLGMELVLTAEDTDTLTILKITHAYDTVVYARLVGIGIVMENDKLVQFALRETFRLHFGQPLSQTKQSLQKQNGYITGRK